MFQRFIHIVMQELSKPVIKIIIRHRKFVIQIHPLFTDFAHLANINNEKLLLAISF